MRDFQHLFQVLGEGMNGEIKSQMSFNPTVPVAQ